MNKIALLTFILGSIPLMFSQVLNLDRENGEDTVFRRNIFSLNFGFSLDKQKRDLIEFSSQLENDFFFQEKQLGLDYTRANRCGIQWRDHP